MDNAAVQGIWILYSEIRDGGIHHVNTETRALEMGVGYNPFKFEVNLQTASLSGIQCTFSCEKDCYVLPVWGVPVYGLFEFMYKMFGDMKHSLTSVHSDRFSGSCQAANDLILLKAGESKTMVFMPPRDLDLTRGVSNVRIHYPFVSVMLLRNADDLKDRMVVTMATIVHVPVSRVDYPPKVIGQYIRTSSHKVALLRKVFLSSFHNEDGEEDVAVCLACCHRPVTCVIVPCGHACMCTTCLQLCKNCPVCRGSLYSYFLLSLGSSDLPNE